MTVERRSVQSPFNMVDAPYAIRDSSMKIVSYFTFILRDIEAHF